MISNINRYDPTRTLTLRNQLITQFKARFKNLQKILKIAIVDYDVLAIKDKNLSILALDPKEVLKQIKYRQFDFLRSSDKIEEFIKWLKELEQRGILSRSSKLGLSGRTSEFWADQYIQTSYEKGVWRARKDLVKNGIETSDFDDANQLVRYVSSSPLHADQLGLIFASGYQEVKGITNAMDQQIARVLAQGIAEGRSVEDVFSTVGDRIDKIGMSRSKIWGMSTIVGAYNKGLLNEYVNSKVDEIQVIAEWVTARDGKVCDQCRQYDGRRYDIAVIGRMFPVHSLCRCSYTIIPKKERDRRI
jgi:hypothetical protein